MFPSRIGPYVVVRKLGEGGMGAVFEVVHEAIERRGAIKILHPEFVRSPEMATRFINEARAVNRVEHPGLVQINDYGQLPDGTAYIVMEYLRGETLADRLRASGGVLSVAETLQIGWQLADTLAATHAKGIIHRDLKPGNVMLVPDPHMPTGERAKILDFGLAKLTASTGEGLARTHSNVIMGTPLYMSPEQCEGANRVDARTDVYSMGCMLYEMLAGQPPFVAEGAGQLLGMHMFKEPPSLKQTAPLVPGPLAELVAKLLRKDKDQRPSMAELATALANLFPLAPTPDRRHASPPPTADSATVVYPKQAVTVGETASAATPVVRRRWPVWLGVSVLAAGAVGAGIYQYAGKSTPARSQVAGASHPEPTASPAPERKVHLRLDSQPAGAEVVDTASGEVLGATPWSREQAPSAGTLRVRLRLPGFVEQAISLDLRSDTAQHVTLSPAPTSAAKTGAAPVTRAGAATVPARPLAARGSQSPSPAVPKPSASPKQPAAEVPDKQENAAAVEGTAAVHTKARTFDSADQAFERADLETTLKAAQSAYTQGNYSRAIELAQSAQKRDPMLAWLLIGSSACKTKNAKLANDAYRRLDTSGRRYLVSFCTRIGFRADTEGLWLDEP